MTLKKGTIAAQIRDKIDLMHALIVSGKKDGGEFSYGEVLVLAGLPSNHSYIRELSNQLIARGYRRHAAKQPKPAPVPTDEDVLLPGDSSVSVDYDKALQCLYEIDRIIEDFKANMKNAMLELSEVLHDQCPHDND